MVSLGIKGLFEMVKETWRSHPGLCKKALQSFFELLQGLDPETLEQEPEEVIGETLLCVHVCGNEWDVLHTQMNCGCIDLPEAQGYSCSALCLLFALQMP